MVFEDTKQKEVDIFHHPKMQEAEAVKKLTGALSTPLQEGFGYGSVQNNVLTFFFEHPALVHEFTLKHMEIKEKMREIYKNEKLSGVIFFREVKAKVMNKLKPYEFKRDTTCPYKEKATGNFSIKSENEKIRSLFEDIQGIIKERNGQV